MEQYVASSKEAVLRRAYCLSNAQARKWTLVINNPLEAGFTHECICETLMRFFPDYFCLADEIAKTGTFHTHIFCILIHRYDFIL